MASDSVYRIVDVVGVSEKSWEDAGRNAVETPLVHFVICEWLKSRKWT
jgi:flavin-binding protein dodecin